jgi:hypothetical protein
MACYQNALECVMLLAMLLPLWIVWASSKSHSHYKSSNTYSAWLLFCLQNTKSEYGYRQYSDIGCVDLDKSLVWEERASCRSVCRHQGSVRSVNKTASPKLVAQESIVLGKGVAGVDQRAWCVTKTCRSTHCVDCGSTHFTLVSIE